MGLSIRQFDYTLLTQFIGVIDLYNLSTFFLKEELLKEKCQVNGLTVLKNILCSYRNGYNFSKFSKLFFLFKIFYNKKMKILSLCRYYTIFFEFAPFLQSIKPILSELRPTRLN